MDLFGKIVVVTNNFPKVKGYMQNSKVELKVREDGKIDVSGAVGKNGYLNIIKDIGLKDPYVGISPLVSGEIAEDFAKYFADSEQKPTVLALGVLVNKDGVMASGGYLLTLMPDATEEIIDKLEKNISKVDSISKMLSEGLTLKEIATKVTGDRGIKVIEENIIPVYECDCSKEKFERGLISLGKKELLELVADNKDIETVCHFCNHKYTFDTNYIKRLIDEMEEK